MILSYLKIIKLLIWNITYSSNNTKKSCYPYTKLIANELPTDFKVNELNESQFLLYTKQSIQRLNKLILKLIRKNEKNTKNYLKIIYYNISIQTKLMVKNFHNYIQQQLKILNNIY